MNKRRKKINESAIKVSHTSTQIKNGTNHKHEYRTSKIPNTKTTSEHPQQLQTNNNSHSHMYKSKTNILNLINLEKKQKKTNNKSAKEKKNNKKKIKKKIINKTENGK